MAGRDVPQLPQRLVDDFGQGPPVGLADPLFERHLEDADARLRREARGGLGDAARAQCPAAAAASVASLINSRSCSSGLAAMTAWRDSARSGISWRSSATASRPAATASMGAVPSGAAATWLTKISSSSVRAPEEDLALVGEVTEEGALGEPGAFGDLGRRGLVVAPLGEELERRLFESSRARRVSICP